MTGAGVVSAIGKGVEAFWRGCLEGRAVVTTIPENWIQFADFHSRLWSPLPELDLESLGIARTERLHLDPVTMLAIGAGREALENAGFTLQPVEERARAYRVSGIDGTRAGVFLGTGIGGAHSFLHNHVHHLHQRTRALLAAYAGNHASDPDLASLNTVLGMLSHGPRYNPFVVSMLMPNAPSAALGIRFSLTGPNVTSCVACAAGTVAVGHGYRAVRDGDVDLAVTGGSEYLYDEHGHIFHGFDVAGTLVRDYSSPETANRPFDMKRSGFLFSQGGAAVLVLEDMEHARRRGAPIMAEVTGFAETFDAHSMMSLAPGGQQIERVLRTALADADLAPGSIDYINAHGTGTRNNDEVEAGVIERVFGKSVRVNSTKSILGHTIGASGAFEAVVTALTLRDGITHACKNLDEPLLDLNFVRSAGHFDARAAVSQSFAFGGHNAAIVMRRFD
ncbi:MAG: beta-ketoacyl-[acyl-carrier-protein] synthase family protein [Pseudomonadota bacterium]